MQKHSLHHTRELAKNKLNRCTTIELQQCTVHPVHLAPCISLLLVAASMNSARITLSNGAHDEHVPSQLTTGHSGRYASPQH